MDMNRSIAFVIHNLVLYETLLPLITECKNQNILCDIYVPDIQDEQWGNMSRDTYNHLRNSGIDVMLINKIPDKNYKIAFYPYLPYYIEVKSEYKIRYQYGMAKPSWNLDSWSKDFDFIFCNGLYDFSVLRAYTQAEIVGMIKYSEFMKKKAVSGKYNLLYLPTYGKHTSIDFFVNHFDEISDTFNIKVKLHHGTTFLEPDRVELIKSKIPNLLDHSTSLVSLIQETDVVLSDGSGAIFDAIYTDTPIVIFKHQKAEPFEGISPLEEQVVECNIVPYITEDENVNAKLLEVIQDEEMNERRRRFNAQMFPVKGKETLDKCMKIINDFLDDNIDHAYHAGHKHLLKEFSELEDQIRQLQEANKNLLMENELNKEKINVFQLNIDEMEQELILKQKTIDNSSLQLIDTLKELHKLEENNCLINKEKEQLRLQIIEQIQRIELMENKHLALDHQFNEVRESIKNLEETNKLLNHELDNIYNSKRWKMANKLKSMLYFTRLIYLQKGYHILKQYGIKVLYKKIRNKIKNKLSEGTFNESITMVNGDSQTNDGYLMNWYEYKFFNFKETKEQSFKLNIKNFNIPMEKGLVSIVLPVYNGEDYVSSAIESILSQTYERFELIIINDGSIDRTAEILDEFAAKDQRIRVVHQENKKIPKTLSKGFDMACGEFYTWTSADNILPNDFLEKMVSELQKDETVGMIYANMKLIDAKGDLITGHGWYEEPPLSGNVILPRSTLELNVYPNNTIGAAFMYRAKIAKLLGHYSSYKHTLEDYDYWMRVNSLFVLRHIESNDPIYFYRWHNKSLTAADKELGITSNRYKLMVLDDFRRDFYLTPLIWIIEGEDQYVEELREYVERKGHIVMTITEINSIDGLNMATPICYLYVASNHEEKEPFIIKELRDVYSYILFTSNKFSSLKCNYSWDAKLKLDATLDASEELQFDFVVKNKETLFGLINTKVKNDHLYKIEAVIESDLDYEKEISVVLCTYQRSQKLINSIESLLEQTLAQEKYEIIVVNNDYLNTDILTLVNDLRRKHNIDESFLRYIEAPLKGLSYARNAGLFEAKGEIILYIDDDAIADSELLKQTIKGFNENPDFGVIGGNIILNINENRPRVVRPGFEAYWSQLVVDKEGISESLYQWEFPYGANFAVRQKALMRIGGFRSSYGRKGNDYAGGEEIVVSFLMKEIGYKVGLNSLMKVIHDVDISRYTVEHVEKTMRSSLLTNYQLQKDLYAPMESNIEEDKEKLVLLREEYKALQRKNLNENSDIELEALYKKFSIEAYEALIDQKEKDTILRKR
ncbi:hypothetical protein J31TS3_37380 [Paenibacillus lactis]|nr:hypothetical protein J31TS3_37380 [Paenibacillus lactis]